MTVPTTLLDWGIPDRAYQGRSFTPHRYVNNGTPWWYCCHGMPPPYE